MEGKKFFIGLIVVLVIVAGVIFWAKGKKADLAAPANNGSESVDVSITTPVTTNDGAVATTTTAATTTKAKTGTVAPAKPASTAPAQPKITKDGIYIISYENTGFNPKNLTISAGKSVRFVNNSSRSMRVYSVKPDNPYSALRQPISVGKGKTYDFNFADRGLWEYYNLSNAADTGWILVK